MAVYVYGTDPVSQAGVAGQLRGRPEIWVVDDGDVDAAAVAVLVADEIDDSITTVARAVQRNGCPRVVLVVTHLDDAGLLAGVEAGACGFLRRADATPERLVETIRSAASGDGSMSSDLLGRLLSQICTLSNTMLSQRGLSLAGLADREVEVLRLIADGFGTAEIAEKMCYSERTVKNVLHDVTTRLQLRNRSHAVAYALRRGLI